jgi:integrase
MRHAGLTAFVIATGMRRRGELTTLHWDHVISMTRRIIVRAPEAQPSNECFSWTPRPSRLNIPQSSLPSTSACHAQKARAKDSAREAGQLSVMAKNAQSGHGFKT